MARVTGFAHSMFMKGIHAKHVPALFSMHEPRTDLDAMLQICTLRSAPAVATRPWLPPEDTASAVTGIACAEKEQNGATPPLHTDAMLHTCDNRYIGRNIRLRENTCGKHWARREAREAPALARRPLQ